MNSRIRGSVVVALVVATQVFGLPAAEARPSCLGKPATKVGSAKADTIKGTKGNDVIVGGKGADLIRGSGGDDLICAGGGGDIAIGGIGTDQIQGQAGLDQLVGGAGNDVLTVGPGFFQFVLGGGGDDRLVGNENFTFTSYFKAKSAVTVDLLAGTASGGNGNDTLIDIVGAEGSDFNDSLSGDSGLNFFFGGGGDDTIESGGNGGTIDELGASGGAPNQGAEYDFMGGGPGNDTLNGNEGLDVVTYDAASEPVDANLTTGQATGEGDDTLSDVEILLGSGFEDTLTGDAEANGFEGYSGADTIDGKAGNDIAIHFDAKGGVTADLAAGTSTADYETFTEIGPISDRATDSLKEIEGLWGSAFDDSLSGDQFDNDLRGLPGDDTLSGLAGNDRLVGGDGSDAADGGDGDDSCDAEDETACESDPTTPFVGGSWLLPRSFASLLHY